MYNYIVETYKTKSELAVGLNKYGKQGWRAISIQRFETRDVATLLYWWDVVFEMTLNC